MALKVALPLIEYEACAEPVDYACIAWVNAEHNLFLQCSF